MDAKFFQKIFKFSFDKLSTVINYHGMGDAKLAYYALPYEPLHLRHRDLGQGFCFDPLREVINRDKQEFFLAWGLWEWVNNSHPPLSDWPKGINRLQLSGRLMDKQVVLLIAFAFLHKLATILLHRQPVISRSKHSGH